MCEGTDYNTGVTLPVVPMAVDLSSGYSMIAVPDWDYCVIRWVHGCEEPDSGDR